MGNGYNLSKRDRYLVALILLALYLSLVEALIPKPFPWLKVGFANIATLIALYKFDSKLALEVVGIRTLLQGIMLGTLFTPSIIISFIAGLSSCFVMIFAKKTHLFSLVATSVLGALAHSTVQLVIVFLWLFRGIPVYSRGSLGLIIVILIIAIIAGAITGVLTTKLNLRKINSI